MEDNPPGTSSRTSHSPSRSVSPVEFPGGFGSLPQGELDFSFWAPEGDEVSIAAWEGGLLLSDTEDSTGHWMLRWQPCLPGQPRALGWNTFHLPRPSVLGWTIVFWGWSALNSCIPSCARGTHGSCGNLLFRAEHASPGPPLSLPSMVGLRGGMWTSPRSSALLRCIYARVHCHLARPPTAPVPRRVSLPGRSW